MGKYDDERLDFLPIFLANITTRQRKDYEMAKEHFGPLYRIEDTNYFNKKFKEFKEGKWPIKAATTATTITTTTTTTTSTTTTTTTTPSMTAATANPPSVVV
jgi:hypothetical protein